MSGREWAVIGGNGRYNAATASAPNAIPPSTALYRPLPPIAHPPDLSAHVVAHQQRAVRQHQETDRPTPARTIGALPTDNEILHTHRAAPTAVHLDAHDLRPGRHGAIPRAVQCHERVAAMVTGELRASVEHEPERCRMRLHRDRRRLDVRAVRRSVLGIGFAGEVALRPAVVPTVLDDVDLLGWQVFAKVIAVVVPAPQRARFLIECHANRIAKALREYVASRAIGVELGHRRPHRVALLAEIA